MIKLLQCFFAAALLFFYNEAGAQKFHEIKGRVKDGEGAPLPFASIRNITLQATVYTDNQGNFRLLVPAKEQEIALEFSYVGKVSQTRLLRTPQFSSFLEVALSDQSLTLERVEVNANRKPQVSNSSIVITRENIAQMQAFSLADVLNNLPGKKVGAPELQNPQNITLRSQAGGNHALSNSLGVAIYMDGVRVSNDANMQGRSVSMHGMSGSRISNNTYGSFDVPFAGIDLRNIDPDNIESIEVVSGVASAEYGELTDGVVIIQRQAGKTKYSFNTKVNGGSSQFSLSKGFDLGGKRGALNVSLSYLNSNQDPRDKVKSYNRVSSSLMYTNNFARDLKNTFSFDYNTRLDRVKQDPDDDARKRTYAENRGFSMSNRMMLTVRNSFIRSVSLSLSYSGGYEETYNQWLLNGPPKGLANKDTTGVYEGIFLPGAYLAEERIEGKPVNYVGTLNVAGSLQTGKMLHGLSAGLNMSGSANNGRGIVVDPERPRWINLNNQNVRPYNFKDQAPGMVNWGIFVQDNFSTRLLGKAFSGGLGLRYDVQSGSPNIQPRINIRRQIGKKWEINMAYGIGAKGATLAHRSPAPTWLDIALLNLYTGYPEGSLFLVYTQKIEADNTHLRSSRSSQFETGLKYNGKFISSSIFAYAKNNARQFNSYNKFQPLELPEYGYTYIPGQKIIYYPTGDTLLYANTTNYVITNGLRSRNYGIEWMLQTEKIRSIQTSFSMTTAFSMSYSDQGGDKRMVQVDDSYILQGKPAWYGVYRPVVSRDMAMASKFTSDTHIPSLGFVFSFVCDVSWLQNSRRLHRSDEPIGYIDGSAAYHPIEKFDGNNPEYGYLKLDPLTSGAGAQPFVYADLHLRIAKEIKKQLRVSISAYNVFNLKAEDYVYDPASSTTIVSNYINPLSISGGVSLKF